MRYQLIVFDFDGTLMDTNAIIKESLEAASMAYRKKRITAEEFEKILGKPLKQQMLDLDLYMADEMVDFYRTYYRENQAMSVKLFEGIRELLEGLKQDGVLCGILTNKGRHGLNNALKTYQLESYFGFTLSAQDVVNAKPYPEGLHRICEYFKIPEAQTLMVGDSAHDIEAGINAGIDTCLVSWTILNMDRLKTLNPNYIVNHPSEIRLINNA